MLEDVWKNMFAGGSMWAGVIAGGVSQLQDTVAWKNGKMKSDDYAINSTKNVTTALGTMAGVEIGAVVGTALLPGIGTAIGSIVGGLMGDRVGNMVGVQTGRVLFKHAGGRKVREQLPMIQYQGGLRVE